MGKRWTAAELIALRNTADIPGFAGYHAFGALTGYSKSYDAWEVKRRRIVGAAPVVPPPPVRPPTRFERVLDFIADHLPGVG